MTYLTTPQYLSINACSWHIKKEKKRNPNLAYEEQTSSKTWRQRLISIKKIKTKAYKIKKWKQKGLD